MVKVIKLVSGEEFVAEVVKQEKGQVVLKEPAYFQFQPFRDEDGEVRINVSVETFSRLVEENLEITLDMGHVLAIMEPRAEVKKFYGQYTNKSELIVPEKKGLVLPT